MNPWMETLLAVSLSLLCFALALGFRRLRSVWLIGGMVGLGLAYYGGDAMPRNTSAFLICGSVPCIIAPLLRLPVTRLTRFGLTLCTLLVVAYAGWMEFLAPALARSELSALKTKITPTGVCLQGTPYTCGPAAAVTVLRKLGFPAEEGELALLGHSSAHTGTDWEHLVEAMDQRFGEEGLQCEFVDPETLHDLKKAGPALTLVHLGGNIAHWVAVIEITDTHVHSGDPIFGVRTESHAKFNQRWMHETVRIWRSAKL